MSRLYPNLNHGNGGDYDGPESVEVVAPTQQQVDHGWKEIFNKYDDDRDGMIELQELKEKLHDQCEADKCGISTSKRARILKKADKDKDGKINYDEFARMMSREDTRMKRLVWAAADIVMPKSMQDDEFINYIDEYSCMPPPIFVLLISAVELSLYIYYAVTMDEFSANGPVPIHSELIYNPYRRKEAWRYLTYMFIHVGYVHIFFNLLVQILLGLPLELVHKFHRFGLIYLIGVIAGCLGHTIVDPNSYLAGASGGVYAVIAAHLANIIMNWKEIPWAWARLLFLLALAATDVGVAIYQRYTQDVDNNIGYAAHFAGSLAGLLIGILVLRNLRVRTWEKVVWWLGLVTAVILLVFAILWNALYTDYYPEQRV